MHPLGDFRQNWETSDNFCTGVSHNVLFENSAFHQHAQNRVYVVDRCSIFHTLVTRTVPVRCMVYVTVRYYNTNGLLNLHSTVCCSMVSTLPTPSHSAQDSAVELIYDNMSF